jgi:uncharacterized membrane protein
MYNKETLISRNSRASQARAYHRDDIASIACLVLIIVMMLGLFIAFLFPGPGALVPACIAAGAFLMICGIITFLQ